MGVDTLIYIRKEDAEKMLSENPFFIVDIYRELSGRFQCVLEKLKMNYNRFEPLYARDVMDHLLTNEGVPKRTRLFFKELLRYDFIIAPDTWEAPKEVCENYVEIHNLYYLIEDLIRNKSKELIKESIKQEIY